MIRIDPNVTEMPESIPWVRALTIHAAVRIGRLLLLAGLTSCASPIVWDAEDSAEFRADDYKCTRDATYTPSSVPVAEKSDDRFSSGGFERGFAKGRNMRGPQLNEELYVMCMESRGYARNE